MLGKLPIATAMKRPALMLDGASNMQRTSGIQACSIGYSVSGFCAPANIIGWPESAGLKNPRLESGQKVGGVEDP